MIVSVRSCSSGSIMAVDGRTMVVGGGGDGGDRRADVVGKVNFYAETPLKMSKWAGPDLVLDAPGMSESDTAEVRSPTNLPSFDAGLRDFRHPDRSRTILVTIIG